MNKNDLPNLTVKLDVNKIDADKLYEGKKGLYLTCYLRPTPNSKYNDYVLVQAVKDGDDIVLGNADVSQFRNSPKKKAIKASAKLPWE